MPSPISTRHARMHDRSSPPPIVDASPGYPMILQSLLMMPAKGAPLALIADRMAPIRGLPSVGMGAKSIGRSRHRSASVSAGPLTATGWNPADRHEFRQYPR